jgi:hypothetical protein
VQVSLRAPVLNLATGLPGIPAGGTAVISVTGRPASLAGWTLTIANAKVDFTLDGDSKLRTVVPPGTPLGPAVLRLTPPSGDPVAPILFHVDAPPPITQAAFAGTVFVDAQHPARAGDSINVDVKNLYGADASAAPSSVHISVGGVDHVATSLAGVLQFGLISDIARVTFTLASGLPDGTQQPLTVRLGTRVSAPYTLNVVPNVVPPAPATVQPSLRN